LSTAVLTESTVCCLHAPLLDDGVLINIVHYMPCSIQKTAINEHKLEPSRRSHSPSLDYRRNLNLVYKATELN